MSFAQLDDRPKNRGAMLRFALDRVRPRRALWRQRLVEAEAGFKLCLRSDSALFVHFFLTAAVLIAGLLLHLRMIEWMLLIVGLTVALVGELFHSALKRLSNVIPPRVVEESREAEPELESMLRISGAAAMTATAGAVLGVVVLFGTKIADLFGLWS